LSIKKQQDEKSNIQFISIRVDVRFCPDTRTPAAGAGVQGVADSADGDSPD
jgi:hypothetical protein